MLMDPEASPIVIAGSVLFDTFGTPSESRNIPRTALGAELSNEQQTLFLMGLRSEVYPSSAGHHTCRESSSDAYFACGRISALLLMGYVDAATELLLAFGVQRFVEEGHLQLVLRPLKAQQYVPFLTVAAKHYQTVLGLSLAGAFADQVVKLPIDTPFPSDILGALLSPSIQAVDASGTAAACEIALHPFVHRGLRGLQDDPLKMVIRSHVQDASDLSPRGTLLHAVVTRDVAALRTCIAEWKGAERHSERPPAEGIGGEISSCASTWNLKFTCTRVLLELLCPGVGLGCIPRCGIPEADDVDEIVEVLVSGGADVASVEPELTAACERVVAETDATLRLPEEIVLGRLLAVGRATKSAGVEVTAVEVGAACLALDVKLLRQLEESGLDANCRWLGFSPLELVILRSPGAYTDPDGHVEEMVSLLCDAGADLELSVQWRGVTMPLVVAAWKHGMYAAANQLRGYGAQLPPPPELVAFDLWDTDGRPQSGALAQTPTQIANALDAFLGDYDFEGCRSDGADDPDASEAAMLCVLARHGVVPLTFKYASLQGDHDVERASASWGWGNGRGFVEWMNDVEGQSALVEIMRSYAESLGFAHSGIPEPVDALIGLCAMSEHPAVVRVVGAALITRQSPVEWLAELVRAIGTKLTREVWEGWLLFAAARGVEGHMRCMLRGDAFEGAVAHFEDYGERTLNVQVPAPYSCGGRPVYPPWWPAIGASTPLEAALMNGHMELVGMMVKEWDARADGVWGERALVMASQRRDVSDTDLMLLLLDKGASARGHVRGRGLDVCELIEAYPFELVSRLLKAGGPLREGDDSRTILKALRRDDAVGKCLFLETLRERVGWEPFSYLEGFLRVAIAQRSCTVELLRCLVKLSGDGKVTHHLLADARQANPEFPAAITGEYCPAD